MIENIYVVVVAGVIAIMPTALFCMDGKMPQVVVVAPLFAGKKEIDRFREELAKTIRPKNKPYPSFDENVKLSDVNTKK